jgi:terminase small subunit-like protein
LFRVLDQKALKNAVILTRLLQRYKVKVAQESGTMTNGKKQRFREKNIARVQSGADRSRKPRTTPTQAEVAFCAYYVLTGNVRQSSIQAGFSPWYGYQLLKLPRLKWVLQELEQRKKEEAWDTAKTQIVVTREFLDEQFIYRLVNMRTHDRTGDMAIVKMLETGYKRTGDIQPGKIVQQQSQGQVASVGQNAFQVYEAAWLTRKKMGWDKVLEQKHSGKALPQPDPN